MTSRKTWPLFALIIMVVSVLTKDVRKLCTSSLANKSCGQCIKQHPDCAWCLDPHMTSSSRCDHKDEFDSSKCSSNLLYSPSTEVKIIPQHNVPLGNKHSDGSTLVLLEPQQIILRMKPGDIVEVPFKYLHRPQQNIKDFVIQTSEFRSLGVGIEFSIICNGKKVSGRQCANVNPNERIEFFAKVSLNECKSGGDIAVSIGAYGYQTVSAMYITPLCGCDCEKVQNQEKPSQLCYNFGDLICGVCECLLGKGGSHCECELEEYGVSTTEQLDNKCRKRPNDLICGGNGQCRCGRCQCNAEHVTGKFCDCEGMSCPAVNGKLCAGQGECSCGKCRCEESFTGDDCSCTLDKSACTEGNVICNEHGSCECGKCVCAEGYSGFTCGIMATDEVEIEESFEQDHDQTIHEEELEDEGDASDEVINNDEAVNNNQPTEDSLGEAGPSETDEFDDHESAMDDDQQHQDSINDVGAILPPDNVKEVEEASSHSNSGEKHDVQAQPSELSTNGQTASASQSYDRRLIAVLLISLLIALTAF